MKRIVYLIKNPKESMIVQKIFFRKGVRWEDGEYCKCLPIGKYGTLIGERAYNKNILGTFVMNTLSDVGNAKKAGLSVKIFNNKLEI